MQTALATRGNMGKDLLWCRRPGGLLVAPARRHLSCRRRKLPVSVRGLEVAITFGLLLALLFAVVRKCTHVAAVAPEVVGAVSQQAIAFAEGFFSRSAVPEDDKGRPQIPTIAAGSGGAVLSAALLNIGGFFSSLGLLVGTVTTSAMVVANVQRAIDLKYDDGDFPGPKAWPAGMALISFFALAAFAQALYVGSTSPDL